ncbi:MAG TPA: flagellar hook-associated protein FlgK, partial [Sulfurospirillum sp. UBA12182]
MSLFSTLGTGTSGLKASEMGISVAGHNISNANNEYYTRQRLVTQASTPLDTTPGSIGTGVSVTTIVRIHDEFVYSRLKDSSGNLSYDSFMKKSLEEVARYFPDLQDVGLGVDIQNYFASWNDLASNSNDGAQKIALVQNAQTLSTNLKSSRDNIRALQDSINEQLKTNVDEINRIGKEIAELNKAIGRVESLDTNRANDLRDQRDQLELTLSNLVDVSVFKGDLLTENTIDANLTDRGTGYHMNIAGNSLVDGMTFHPLVIENSSNESNYYSIYSESQDGSRVEVTEKLVGGKVGAMLDLRGRHIDPEENSGFPSDGVLQKYIDDLDTFANTFIEQTN